MGTNKKSTIWVMSAILLLIVGAAFLINAPSKTPQSSDSISGNSDLSGRHSNANTSAPSNRPTRPSIPTPTFDVDGALRHIESLQNKDEKGEAVAQMVIAWSVVDPASCFRWASGLEDRGLKSAAFLQFSSTLARAGRFDELIPYIEKEAEGEFKDDMIVYAMTELANHDMDQAFAVAKGASGAGAVKAVARNLAAILVKNYQPDQIASRMEQQPPGPLRDFLNVSLQEAERTRPR